MPTFKSEVNKFIVTRPYLYKDLTLENFQIPLQIKTHVSGSICALLILLTTS